MNATVWKERQSVLIQDFQHEEILNIEANACFRGDQIPGVQVYWGQLCHGQVWQDIKGWLSPSALSWLTSWLTRCLQMRRRRSPPTWWVSTKQSRLWLRSKLILPELHLKSTYQASSRNGVSRTSSSLSRWLWKLNLKQTRLVDIDFTTQDFNEEDPKTWKDVDPKATTMAEVYKVNNRFFLDAKVNENSSEIWPWWEHLRLCGTRIGSVQVDHSTLDIFTNLDHNRVQFFCQEWRLPERALRRGNEENQAVQWLTGQIW